ncbi:MAG: gliding motility-associated C-terminal domain-containing protein, partial [Culturomica sp.]|jgi:gliding motility-associated-like protein|nr:gliding motility-associated C-terminal domain-containing protein [Culturomica sp.]
VTIKEYGTENTLGTDNEPPYILSLPEPGKNVEVTASYDFVEYPVNWTLIEPSGANTAIKAYIVKPEEDTEVWQGGTVQHGDSLKFTVTLLEAPGGGTTDTWYSIQSVAAQMGDKATELTPNTAGRKYTYTLASRVSGAVTLDVTVARLQQQLYWAFVEEVMALGNILRITTEGSTTADYGSSGNLPVDVGSEVIVQALPGSACVADSLTCDLGDRSTGAPFEITFQMPVNDAVLITGYFSLKQYPVTLSTYPDDGGTLAVRDDRSGFTYLSSVNPTFRVSHGSDLVDIIANRTDEYYSLDSVTGYAGKTDALYGQSAPYHIANVQDSVGLSAWFSRRYKVILGTTANGTLHIREDGSGSVVSSGTTYAAGQTFTISVAPAPGYTCTATYVLLQPGNVIIPVVLTSNEGTYTIPTGADYRDAEFMAEFALKTYTVHYSVNDHDIPAGDAPSQLSIRAFSGASPGVPVANSGQVQHGDSLEIVLTPHLWYDIHSLTAVMNALPAGMPSGPDTLRMAEAQGDVVIRAEVQRKRQKLYINVEEELPASGNTIWVFTEGGAPLVLSATDSLTVDAGSEISIQAAPDSACTVALLDSRLTVPATEAPFSLTFSMPVDDSVSVVARFVLKEYPVAFTAVGEGTIAVTPAFNGMTGNLLVSGETVKHGTRLEIVTNPASAAYRLAKFLLHLPGRSVPMAATDTVVTATEAVTAEAVFEKQYVVEYEQPRYGSLKVMQDGRDVISGTYIWVPGGALSGALEVDVSPDEGYEPEALTVNGGALSAPYRFDFGKDESFDTIRIRAQIRPETHYLTLLQPENGEIRVEYSEDNGTSWTLLNTPYDMPVPLHYRTQIRAHTTVDDPSQYRTDSLLLNGKPWTEGTVWTVKEDAVLKAVINPNIYTIFYQQPAYGRLWVETQGSTVENEDALYFNTPLTVRVELDDPVGYELTELTVNGQAVESGHLHRVDSNVHIAAQIALRRWNVTRSVNGGGSILLYDSEGNELTTNPAVVNHYETLRMALRPVADWMLYECETVGADVYDDLTFVVKGDATIFATFRQTEVFQFPVVFTPNGDGYNDTWEVKGLWQTSENTLEIYNRSQQRVYKASPYHNDWNGTTDNGAVLPAGVYIYKLTVGAEQYLGIISIIRN